ncbi:hypothetical protein GCM10028821_19640 [Hymenobacter jeollabukensis]
MQNASEPPVPILSDAEAAVPTGQHQPVRLAASQPLRSDTISLHYETLQRFLPEHVAGFVREGSPQGESVQLGGISYSTCEQHYRKGNQRLKVQLVDYNGAQALYAGATALMSTDIWQESDEQLMRGCDLGLPGVRGYETVQKLERRAAVALGVGDRFFVSVESTGQEDTRLVKAVARTLDLRGLAAL